MNHEMRLAENMEKLKFNRRQHSNHSKKEPCPIFDNLSTKFGKDQTSGYYTIPVSVYEAFFHYMFFIYWFPKLC
jgi:hypothetical protein